MARIALVLVHSGTAVQNEKQVSDVAALATPVAQDPNAFTISGVLGHFFTGYQIVAPGVPKPTNMHTLPSYRSVIYTGAATTGRYFNWAIRSAVDDAADVVVHVSDSGQLSVLTINAAIAKIPPNHFLESEPFGRVVTIRWLLSVKPLLDDSKTYAQLIDGYKARAAADGLING